MEGSSSSKRSSTSRKVKVTEVQDDEIEPLSGKPWFPVILTRSHIKPEYNMYMPNRMSDILPSKDIPTVLMYSGKEWKMVYYGDPKKVKRFNSEWKHFVDDNDLKAEDVCVFELMVCTARQVKFKVQILRDDIPPALQARLYGDKA
ncbi:B3 domain-containing protein Os04g0386900-like [Punica granatum]|uniref:B3 domain-containing protein Os04g0386900-like n=2 Tax=Punica granatum TaxID=22663 RepID=A0A6P8DFJ5_PUNGR|nr:B3 domain-containing protein Os04g0386900-like [Punica granatum]